ncbi:hypothetical protein PsorP6_017648 [Peronosclerospora sorghi]|uniref:Uncharacterized protein n=1 Tax=Peronosclerospora sorghi TaxID=230839 RepID=A0ACC0WPV1_9STRA|nr:hypothetical protein PsorP6_017648 [Peronosclerospora sorghi]
MKLQLAVVIVLSSIAAVVKSSLDLVPHDVLPSADLGRNGAQTVRYLRSSAGPVPKLDLITKEWKNAFVQARQQFFDAASKTRLNLANKSQLAPFQRIRLIEPSLANNKLPIVNRVNILNTMKMSDDLLLRLFAEDQEKRLVQKWLSQNKNLEQVFEDLQLNKFEAEMDLYSSPAFATWMAYAKSRYRGNAYREMIIALKNMPISEKLGAIDAIRGMRQRGEFSHLEHSEAEALLQKWNFIENYQHHEHARQVTEHGGKSYRAP